MVAVDLACVARLNCTLSTRVAARNRASFFSFTLIHVCAQGQVADAAPGDLFDIGGGVKMHMMCQGRTITPACDISIFTYCAGKASNETAATVVFESMEAVGQVDSLLPVLRDFVSVCLYVCLCVCLNRLLLRYVTIAYRRSHGRR